MKRILNLFIVVALAISALMAQQQQPSAADVAALMQKVRDLEDRVVILEGQLRQVKAQQQPAQPTATAPAGLVVGSPSFCTAWSF